MKAKQIFTVTALALAASGAFAQEAASLTRAEVKQQVLTARANGTLIRAGEAGPEQLLSHREQIQASSTLTRPQVKSAVLEARAAHQLAHAGEAAPEEERAYARAHPTTSTLTRGEVRQQVIEARANGTLIPAGQGGYAHESGTARRSTFAKATTAPGDNAVASRGK